MKVKTVFLMLPAALALPPITAGWPPTITGSFPAPSVTAVDVCYDQGDLYVLTNEAIPRIYRLDSNNGSVISYISLTPTSSGGVRGLAETNDPYYFYVTQPTYNRIYVFTTSGSLLMSITQSFSPYGIAYTRRFETHNWNSGFFITHPGANRVYAFSTSGSLYASFTGPGSNIVDYDEWFAAETNSTYLYWNYGGNWSVLATMPAIVRGVGVEVLWPTDQTVTAYVLCYDNYIYKFSGSTAVNPASLGKVKALFK